MTFCLPNPMNYSLFPLFSGTVWALSRCCELLNYPFLAQFIELTGLDSMNWDDYHTGFILQCEIKPRQGNSNQNCDAKIQLNCMPLINLRTYSPEPIHVMPGALSYPLLLDKIEMAVHRLLSAEAIIHRTREKKFFASPQDIDFLSEPNWQDILVYRMFILTSVDDAMTLSLSLLVSDDLGQMDVVVSQVTEARGLRFDLTALPIRISARPLKKVLSLTLVKQLLAGVPIWFDNPKEFGRMLTREPSKPWQEFLDSILSIKIDSLNEMRHGIFTSGLQIHIIISRTSIKHQILLAWIYMLLLDHHGLVVVKYCTEDAEETVFRREAFEYGV